MFVQEYKNHPDCKVSPSLLWEYDYDKFPWQEARDIVVERVIERGIREDYYAILNMYGVDGVIESIKRIKYLNPKDENFVCIEFNIKKEDLRCYKLRQSTQRL